MLGRHQEPGGLEYPLAAFLTSSMHNLLVEDMRGRQRVEASRKTSKKVRAGLGILPNSRPDRTSLVFQPSQMDPWPR